MLKLCSSSLCISDKKFLHQVNFSFSKGTMLRVAKLGTLQLQWHVLPQYAVISIENENCIYIYNSLYPCFEPLNLCYNAGSITSL